MYEKLNKMFRQRRVPVIGDSRSIPKVQWVLSRWYDKTIYVLGWVMAGLLLIGILYEVLG